jgi:hypothetical protein
MSHYCTTETAVILEWNQWFEEKEVHVWRQTLPLFFNFQLTTEKWNWSHISGILPYLEPVYMLDWQFIRYTHLVPGWTPLCLLNREQSEFFRAWKRYSIGVKGPNLCQKNIPHTIATSLYHWHQAGWGHGLWTPLPSAWCNRNQDSLNQAMFFHSSIVHCSCSFFFLADRSGTRCGRLLQ